jgi:hypothetical protein
MEKAHEAMKRHQMQAKRQQQHLSDLLPSNDLADDPDLRYHISSSQNDVVPLYAMLHRRGASDDPALKVSHGPRFTYNWNYLFLQDFLPKLQEHLLGRLLGQDFNGDNHGTFTPSECQSLRILGDKIYSVQTCRLYYTSYDIRRVSDTIHLTTRPDIIVGAPPPDQDETSDVYERFWYARVIGIYHAKVYTTHPRVQDGGQVRRMEFLWVRWFGSEPNYKHGFDRGLLPKIGFVPSTDDFAFGFLDPACVIRSCHLVPAFAAGRTTTLLPYATSVARRHGVLTPMEADDWTNFYVSM